MRLGQLSRQTKLKTSDIVEYLANQGITIKSGSNAKVDDEYVELVYSGFNLELPVETVEIEIAADANEHETDSELEQDTETLVEADEVPLNSDPHSEINELYEGLDDDDEFSTEEIVEIKARIEANKIAKDEADRPENPNLIKAPKVSLQGLKVVGKIDLPEPKVKEEVVAEEKPGEDEVEKPIPVEVVRNKKRNTGPNRQSSRNRKTDVNPVELKRQREEKAVRQRKKRELRKDKERKRKHYHKVTQEKKKEVIRKEKLTVEATIEVKKPVLQHKKVNRGNFISRFWRWLDAKNPVDK